MLLYLSANFYNIHQIFNAKVTSTVRCNILWANYRALYRYKSFNAQRNNGKLHESLLTSAISNAWRKFFIPTFILRSSTKSIDLETSTAQRQPLYLYYYSQFIYE